MNLPKDLFSSLENNLELLYYLRSVDRFTVEEFSKKFDLKKWAPYKQIKEWKEREWLLLLSTTSKSVGVKQYHYSISNGARKKVNDMARKMTEEFRIEEKLIQRISKLDEILSKEQIAKLSTEIKLFFTDFFK